MVLSIDASAPVVRLDLNRPDEGNSVTTAMMREIVAALRTYGADPATRVIALVARGEMFCSGRDVGDGSPSDPERSAYELRNTVLAAVLDVYAALAACPVPTAACVQGDAVGFGAAMAAACDLTLLSDQARMGFTEIEHNIPPALAMAAAIRCVPLKALSWLVYSAEKVDAATAVSMGLASQSIPKAEFASETEAFLGRLASRPRRVLETVKNYHTKARTMAPEAASDYAGTLLALLSTAKA
jgi:enoyl-CoA hydratase/carnithine racemase